MSMTVYAYAYRKNPRGCDVRLTFAMQRHR